MLVKKCPRYSSHDAHMLIAFFFFFHIVPHALIWFFFCHSYYNNSTILKNADIVKIERICYILKLNLFQRFSRTSQVHISYLDVWYLPCSTDTKTEVLPS